jgi:hypothetical protein
MNLILRKESPDITKRKLRREYKNLLMAIEALPGVHVGTTNLITPFDKMKKQYHSILIFLHIEEGKQEGLFFLTRSISRRYWEYGHKWKMEVEAGDQIYPNGDRPINYIILRPLLDSDTEQDILDECLYLVSNMNHHFHHDGFMNGFSMNKDEYHVVDEVAYDRNDRLKELGIN